MFLKRIRTLCSGEDGATYSGGGLSMGIGTIDSGPVSNVSMVISNVTLNGNQVPGAFFFPETPLT